MSSKNSYEAAPLDFQPFFQKTTWKQVIDVLDNAAPADLSNRDFKLYVRSVQFVGEPILALSVGNGLTIVNNTIEMKVPLSDTDIKPGDYYYDLRIKEADDEDIVLYGKIPVWRTQTNPF
ncbi:hypothetical protein [Peijinzhouia sedimentorum]